MSLPPPTNKIHSAFPYLRVSNAAKAIEFYSTVFGATERFRLTEPSGRIGHAEMNFGTSVVMLSDEYPEHGIKAPADSDPAAPMLHLHVDNVDALTDRAVQHGAKLTMAPQDQFYGERSAKFVDPFNHIWLVGQSIEEVSPAEMQRRYDELMKPQ